MKLNKKAEGSASSFLISLIIGLAALVGISSILLNSTNSYGVDNINEFDYGFAGNLSEVKGIGGDFSGSIELTNQSSGDYSTTEDLTFGKALKAVMKLPKTAFYAVTSLITIGGLLQIPPEIMITIGLIITITLIALIVQVIRGYKNV